MSMRIYNFKEFVITTIEGTERGLFFRSPLQNIDFDAYHDEARFSAWKYISDIKNPIRKLYEILIGNKEIVKNVDKWSEDCNFAGFRGNILCSPIYFKRQYRKLKAISSSNETNIKKVISYGYESEFNTCSGDCVIEKTVVVLRNGEKIKMRERGKYFYTYSYCIEKLIKGLKP